MDKNGKVARFDRVVHDTDLITVIDYKTGDYEKEHTDQMKRYMRIIRDVYRGKQVKGYLAYIDKKEIREIKL